MFVCGLFWSVLGTGIFGNFGTGHGDFPDSGRKFTVALVAIVVVPLLTSSHICSLQ